MNNDQINELLALMGQQIKDHAELRVETTRRFEQLTDVMVNGFLRLEDRLGARIDRIAARVDILTGEVREVKADIGEIKVQAQETNRRLANTFDHVGQLTEQTDEAKLRLSHVEAGQQPTNAELDARLKAVEAQLRNAS